MKPIKLVISAFGPYAETMPEIDFTSLEADGLFLISGETGAGKTTIFDAMVFALFGRTSGAYKDTKFLRSEYAKTGVDSFVEFTFSHRGKVYRIRRSPSYLRPKARGEGFVEQKETVVLSVVGSEGTPADPTDMMPTEGLTAVASKLAEILNFDYARFKQVAMIAQGEFLKLLNASTEERTAILRGIFMTDVYARLVRELKNLSDESYARSEDARKAVVQYFEGVRLAGEVMEASEGEELLSSSERDAGDGLSYSVEGDVGDGLLGSAGREVGDELSYSIEGDVGDGLLNSSEGYEEDEKVGRAGADAGVESEEGPEAEGGATLHGLAQQFEDISDRLHAAKTILSGDEITSFIDRAVEADEETLRRLETRAGEVSSRLGVLRESIGEAKADNDLFAAVEAHKKKLSEILKYSETAAGYERDIVLTETAMKIGPLYEARLAREKDEQRLKTDLETTLDALAEECKAYESAAKKRDEAAAAAAELPELQSKAAVIENSRADYEKRDKARSDEAAHRSAFEEGEKRVKELEQKKAEVLEEEAQLDRLRESLKDSAFALAAAKAADKAVKKQKEDAERLSERAKSIAEDEKELERRQQEAEKKIEAYGRMSQERLDKERIFDGCRAGLLAEKLVKGKPCPVCGSKEHPMCAALPADRV
ncbi:MAG: SMC family ATPase, partial [Lachnospiraceae bacterium]|nr:SMC family ATPase [Lachnospiraceae bacterium]